MFATADIHCQCRCVIMAQWWVQHVRKWYREFGRTSAVTVTGWPNRSRPDVGAGLMDELIL